MYHRLRRLHVFRSALALAIVAGFLATPIGLAHAGRLAHDPCDAPELVQDPATPRMDSSAGLDPHGHCFTCHWFQSLRSALIAAAVAIPDAGAAAPFRADSDSTLAACRSTCAGARAPPA